MQLLSHLPEPDEEREDMSVVVEHSRGLHVRVKLRLTLSVERFIEVLLPLIEAVFSQHHCPASQRIAVSELDLLVASIMTQII